MTNPTDSVWFKIGLALIPVVGIMIGMWSDVRSLKSERALITDGRLVRLEEQVKTLQGQVAAQWRRREERSRE